MSIDRQLVAVCLTNRIYWKINDGGVKEMVKF
jgi:hypothetical protein